MRMEICALDTALCTLPTVCDMFSLRVLFCSSKVLHKVENHFKHIFQMPHVMLMTTYQTVIIQNVILNGCRCHFGWYWSVVLLGALCLYQQVGRTNLSMSQRVHGCIDLVWLLRSRANLGSPEGQACCPIKQQDHQTGSGQYPGNRHHFPTPNHESTHPVVIETAGLHSFFISFYSCVPITWPR